MVGKRRTWKMKKRRMGIEGKISDWIAQSDVYSLLSFLFKSFMTGLLRLGLSVKWGKLILPNLPSCLCWCIYQPESQSKTPFEHWIGLENWSYYSSWWWWTISTQLVEMASLPHPHQRFSKCLTKTCCHFLRKCENKQVINQGLAWISSHSLLGQLGISDINDFNFILN